MNWLSFVAADLHKSFSPLFALKGAFSNPTTQADVRKWAVGGVEQCLRTLNDGLAGKEYLLGREFCVADAYAFVVTQWAPWLELPMDAYPHVNAWLERMSKRPAVHKVLKEEGLLD
jgi:glutathione S-transferase